VYNVKLTSSALVAPVKAEEDCFKKLFEKIERIEKNTPINTWNDCQQPRVRINAVAYLSRICFYHNALQVQC